MNKFVVPEHQNNMRLDKVLVAFMPDKSRTHISKIIDDGLCLVNDKVAKSSLKVRSGDVISIDIPDAKPLDVVEEDIPLNIIYEDSDILIIDKPQGMVVHPSNGHWVLLPSLSKITGLISVKIGVHSMAGTASQPPHDSPAPPAVSMRIPWNGFSCVLSLAIYTGTAPDFISWWCLHFCTWLKHGHVAVVV